MIDIQFLTDALDEYSYVCMKCSIYDTQVYEDKSLDEDRYLGDSPEALLGHLLLHSISGETIPDAIFDEAKKLVKEEGLCLNLGTELALRLNMLMSIRS